MILSNEIFLDPFTLQELVNFPGAHWCSNFQDRTSHPPVQGPTPLVQWPVISLRHWEGVSYLIPIKLDVFPNFPQQNCFKETAIKFSWLPLQRTASNSPRRWMDMSNATKVEEQAVSTVTLTPSSPRQKEIRFAAILALDGNGWSTNPPLTYPPHK